MKKRELRKGYPFDEIFDQKQIKMKHQLKPACGNLKRSSFPTLLNRTGLTAAFASFLLIMLYVWNEYHFDCFNEHIDEICRLEVKSPDNPKTSVFLLVPTGQTLVNEFPDCKLKLKQYSWIL